MAFVNERLTPEQREEFRKRGIKKPTSNHIANPLFVTIDKETGDSLWCLSNFGRDDFHDYQFLFKWHENEYFIAMKYSNPIVGKVVWSISRYEKNFKGNEPYISELKKALVVFGINGSPEQRGNIEIMIELGGDV
jgi:hypothetical protein